MIDLVFGQEDDFVVLAQVLGFKKVFGVESINLLKSPNQSNSQKLNLYSGSQLRKVVKKVDLFFELEASQKADFLHQRRGNLNQVICQEMVEHDVAYGLSFSLVLNSQNKDKVLGRMKQNIKLCRKYEVPLVVASFARSPFELRAPNDLLAFFKALGLSSLDFKQGKNFLHSFF